MKKLASGTSIAPLILIIVVLGLLLFVLLEAHNSNTVQTPASTSLIPESGPKVPAVATPITHVIVIFQENRAFDTLFGTYPSADGIPNNTCIPINVTTPGSGCVTPFLLNKSQDSSPDFPHNYYASLLAEDGGKMDGFITAAYGCNMNVGYYDNSTVPFYWDYAKRFTLSDNTFQSFLGYSPTNHWALIAALAPLLGFYKQFNSTHSTYNERIAYVHEGSSIPTLAGLMSTSNVSWKYYDKQIPSGQFSNALKNGSVIDFWNPFLALNSSYTHKLNSHFALRGKIFSDINSSQLPNVSWVIPSAPISDHAPANLSWGMYWVASIVNAVGRSKYWNSTAIFITWDDYGGWYDNVVPPYINSTTDINGTAAVGAGMRVPLLIISPYSKSGYVDHTQYTFSSIIKFIEYDFGLPSLNVRDSTANSTLDAFNFSQAPLLPLIELLNSSQMAIVNKWAFTPTGNLTPAQNTQGACTQLAFRNAESGAQNKTYLGFINGNPD